MANTGLNISGIYKIESKVHPERIYIGSSKNILQRWKGHLTKLRGNRHFNCKLQYHFDKYGEESLILSVIEECEKECLIEREQYYLDTLDTWFNIREIADRPSKGYFHTEETKKKMSKAKKGKPSWNKGIKTGPQSEELREIHRLANLGQVPWIKGRHHKESSKKKTSRKLKGRKKDFWAIQNQMESYQLGLLIKRVEIKNNKVA